MDINILVVEDEYKILEVIEAYLKKEGFNVITCENGKDAILKFKNNKPHLIILDLMLPDISGEEVCKIVRKEGKTPIIMVTAKGQEEHVLNGFSLGCDDYVTKPFSVKQLVARVKALLNRSYNIRSNILCFKNGYLKINEETFEVLKDNKKIELTLSEFKILLALSKNPKKVFTREELLLKISEYELDVYDRIIDSHIKNIRGKIEEDRKNPTFILTVRGIGYKFNGE